MKTKLISLILLIGCSGLAGCIKVDSGKRVLVVLKTLQNPYFQEMRRGIADQAKAALPGVEIDVKSGAAEGDVSGQRVILEEYANRFIEGKAQATLVGVIITPASSGPELIPILTRFVAAGIPVVVLDTKLVGQGTAILGAYSAFRGSDNKLGGEIAGEEIRRLFPTGGNILLLNGLEGHETAVARREGFLGQFRDLNGYSITQRTCNWDKNEARSTLTALLDAGQQFNAIFAANDEMALGAMEAKRQKGLSADTLPIIGFDATKEAKEAVSQKTLHATIAQNPAGMGSAGVDVLVSLIAKRPVDRDQFIPVEIVK